MLPEQIIENLKITSKGEISQCLRNCVTVFQEDELLKGAIKYNVLTGITDIVKPLGWERNGIAITDTDENYLLLYMEDNYGLKNDKNIQKAISIIANENKYHPICEYLNSLEWDETPRIGHALTEYFGADESDYTYEVLKVFMLGAINRVFHPGCKFDTMLCLIGGQGCGKSTFFRFMSLVDEWFTDDLKKLDDENVFRKLMGHWIIEMSEMLATVNAKGNEEIKAFITRQKETYKVPYEKNPADRLRQCVFVGTSNTIDFLPADRTGNRRFHPIMVHPEKAKNHILDNEAEARVYITQMWAEAMEIYRSGHYTLALSKAMENNLEELTKQFMPEDTKVGVVQDYLDNYKGKIICTRQIFSDALKHPYDEAKQWEIREINSIMNNSITGWKAFSNPRSFAGHGRQRGWERDNQFKQPESKFESISDDVIRQLEIPFE